MNEVFEALAHPIRREILKLLRKRAMSAGELSEHFTVAKPTLSGHFTVLKNADFAYFDDNKDGRVSRAEFVDKPNPFFARYDRKNECSVSLDNIVNPPSESKGSKSR